MDEQNGLLRPIEEHELPAKKGIWSRLFIIFIALGLVVLLSSYVLTSYSVRSIIAGFFDSDEVSAGTIRTQYGDIHLELETWNEIQENYRSNEKEFKLCLDGEYDGAYYINKVSYPKIYEQDYDRVVSAPCIQGTLIELHSHPQQHCVFSAQDLRSFTPKHAHALMMVMCTDNRFIVHKEQS